MPRIPAEDALEWDTLRERTASEATIDIAVMRLPRVANLDEFQTLAAEPGVRVRFVASPDDFGSPDLVIIPGTKSTLADLEWLRERGLAAIIQARRAAGTPVLGICGGFQMLGDAIVDQHGAESAGSSPGLGLLPMTTVFEPNKVTRQVRVMVVGHASLWHPGDATHESVGSLPGDWVN